MDLICDVIESWLFREVFTEQSQAEQWLEESREPPQHVTAAEVWEAWRLDGVLRIAELEAIEAGEQSGEAPAGWYETSIEEMEAIAARG